MNEPTESRGYIDYVKAKGLFLKDRGYSEILARAKSALELGLRTSEEAEMYQLIGMSAYNEGHLAQAEAELTKALELDKKSEEKLNALLYVLTCQKLALINEDKGRLQQSVEILEGMIAHLDSQYDPKKQRGAFAMALNDVAAAYLGNRSQLPTADDQASANLQRAVEIFPEYPDSYFWLGWLYGTKEISHFYEPRIATEHYERYLALSKISSDEKETAAKRKHVVERLALLKHQVVSTEQQKPKGLLKKLFG